MVNNTSMYVYRWYVLD